MKSDSNPIRAPALLAIRAPALLAIRAPALLALIPVSASLLVHSSVLSYDFRADDIAHFYDAANAGFLELVFTPAAGHNYLFRNTILYVFYRLFGLDPVPYFGMMVLSHSLNSFLLYRLLMSLSGRPLLAAFCSTLWGMSPVNQGALGWFSAFGSIHVGLFLLLLLSELLRLRKTASMPGARAIASWYLLAFCMATSFAVGLALCIVLPAVAWLVFSEHPDRSRITRLLSPSALLVPAFCFLSYYIHAYLSGRPAAQPFSDILKPDYWPTMLRLSADLYSYGLCSLLLGPIFAFGESGVVLGPLRDFNAEELLVSAHAMALPFLAWLAWTTGRSSVSRRRIVLAFLMLSVTSYAAISVGRAWLVDMFCIRIECTVESCATVMRYHYVGPLMLAVLGGLIADETLVGRSWPFRRGLFLLAIWTVAMVYPCYKSASAMYAEKGEAFRQEYQRVMREIEDQIDRSKPGGAVYLENRALESKLLFGFAGKFAALPGWAALFAITYPDNTVDGKKVYFVESDPEILRMARSRPHTYINRLLVPRRR
mgnify:CR=1 FL=1